MKKFRVGILGIFHESNTFYPSKTTFESFKGGRGFQTGEEIRASYRGGLHQVSGFFEVLESEGIEPVPLFLTGAGPTGIIKKGTLQKLWGLAEERLTAAGPLDGILAAPHGAAAAEDHADADGWWLTKLREAVGPGKPIIATLDPHVNLSQKMIRACNAFVAFKQNPHIDQKETGIEAARLMARTLRGEIRPVQAATLPPIAINIERQLTFEGPCNEIQQQLNLVRAVPGVLSASLALGYQYADVKKMGSGFIVVTDNQPILAEPWPKPWLPT
jgi:microcystin degradation protein MlrC